MAAVSYMFEKKMLIQVLLQSDQSYETLWNDAVERGAHDVNEVDSASEGIHRRVEVISPLSLQVHSRL